MSPGPDDGPPLLDDEDGDRPAGRLVVRWQHALPVVLVVVLLVTWAIVALRPDGEPPAVSEVVPEPPEPSVSLPPGLAESEGPGEPGESASVGEAGAEHRDAAGSDEAASQAALARRLALPVRRVSVYRPDASRGALVARDEEIFVTRSRLDQVKQVVNLLLRDPARGEDRASGSAGDEPDAPEEMLTAPFPEGTQLRHVFLDATGTAHVSLSEEAREAAPGGSAWEILAVQSLANTLVRAFPEVRAVRILVNDHEVETLGGHLDLGAAYGFSERVVATEP